ncbi:MAG: FliA/WhiG family RNA polymerase sigma factor [Thermacetogeniaceae bacterium]
MKEKELETRDQGNTTQQLWYKFKTKKDLNAREQLILHYIHLVKYVAGRIAVSLKGYFEVDDLVSAGVYGLINAVDRFNPDRGIKFETFALARIKGAIIDWLRSLNWVPQSVRSKAKKLEKAMVELEKTLGRPPEDQELADYLGLDLKSLSRLLHEVAPSTLLSFDEYLCKSDSEEGLSPDELIADANAVNPAEHIEFEEMKRILSEAIEKLPEKEKLVITLYYYEGLTLKEIGQVLNLSESRISQLHTKAILRLRGRLSRKKSGLVE